MEGSVSAVERLVSYSFKNKQLLEEALTHPSYTDSASYNRLAFLGDSAIGLAISDHFFLAYPNNDRGQLTLLRSANVCNENLARVAVRHCLYQYLRRNSAPLDDQVRKFVDSVTQEDGSVTYGGSVGAPKVLADIVESVAGAIYLDVNCDIQRLWVIISGLLEPVHTPEDLLGKPHPVTWLFEVCKRNGKQVDIENCTNGSDSVATVYVDGNSVASGWSTRKNIAKLNAATEALEQLSKSIDISITRAATIDGIDGSFEIEEAKQKLGNFCCQKKWPKPEYSMEKELGPPHERRFVYSVKIATCSDVLCEVGDEKSRKKDAKNYAASLMIRALQERNYFS